MKQLPESTDSVLADVDRKVLVVHSEVTLTTADQASQAAAVYYTAP